MTFEKLVVIVDNFGTDTSGNPIARHTVYGYRHADQREDSPSAELYQTRSRRQVGYSGFRDEWVPSALAKAGFPHAAGRTMEGSRSEGRISFTFSKPVP